MDEITAEQVWEMVKGIDIPKLTQEIDVYRTRPNTPEQRIEGWCIVTDDTASITPRHALALIVDACKREMGEAWLGCSQHRSKGVVGWAAFYKRKSCTCCGGSADAPTESAAVLAAYRAWKEGK